MILCIQQVNKGVSQIAKATKTSTKQTRKRTKETFQSFLTLSDLAINHNTDVHQIGNRSYKSSARLD